MKSNTWLYINSGIFTVLGLATLIINIISLKAIGSSEENIKKTTHVLVHYIHERFPDHGESFLGPGILLSIGIMIIFIPLFGLYGFHVMKYTYIIMYVSILSLCIVLNMILTFTLFQFYSQIKHEWYEEGTELQLLIEHLCQCCGFDSLKRAATKNCTYPITCGDLFYGHAVSILYWTWHSQIIVNTGMFLNSFWLIHLIRTLPGKYG